MYLHHAWKTLSKIPDFFAFDPFLKPRIQPPRKWIRALNRAFSALSIRICHHAPKFQFRTLFIKDHQFCPNSSLFLNLNPFLRPGIKTRRKRDRALSRAFSALSIRICQPAPKFQFTTLLIKDDKFCWNSSIFLFETIFKPKNKKAEKTR